MAEEHFNPISVIVGNSVLVQIQNSIEGFSQIVFLSLSHSKTQQIPLELEVAGDESHLSRSKKAFGSYLPFQY